MRLHDIAVVGASGLVGRKILEIIQERKFEVGKVVAIASDASAGKEINVHGKTYRLNKLEPNIFQKSRIRIFSPQAVLFQASGLRKQPPKALLL